MKMKIVPDRSLVQELSIDTKIDRSPLPVAGLFWFISGKTLRK